MRTAKSRAPLGKKTMEEFRGTITKRMNDLISEARQQMGNMTEVKETPADLTDQASEEMDRNFLLRIKDRERKLILKMREAIERIDAGTFGVCEVCGESIGMERLRARPVTTQCIECKTDMEEQEKRMEA